MRYRYLAMMMKLLVWMMMSTTLGVKVKNIDEGGVLLTHIASAVVRQGIVVLTVNTTIDQEADEKMINKVTSDFETMCKTLGSQNISDSNCEAFKKLLYQEKVKMMKNFRAKRSHGLFGLLHDIFFGVDESEQHINELKQRQHVWNADASKVMQEMLRVTNESQQILTSKINDLQHNVNDFERYSYWATTINESIVNEYVLLTYVKSKEVIKAIGSQYESLAGLEIGQETLEQVQQKLPSNSRIMLSDADNKYQSKVVMGETGVTVQYEIPVVSKNTMEILRGTAVPEKDLLIELDAEYIVVDHTSLAYASLTSIENLMHVEEDTLILPNMIFTREEAQLSCLAATVLRKPDSSKHCKTKRIIENYDIVKKPTKMEMLVIFTTYPKDVSIICDGKRLNVNFTKAVVWLDESCILKTRTSMYKASITIREQVVKNFYQPIREMITQEHLVMLDSPSYNESKYKQYIKPVDLTKLTESIHGLQNDQIEVQDLTTRYIVIGAGIASIVILLIIGIIIYCCIRCKMLAFVEGILQRPQVPTIPPPRPLPQKPAPWPEMVT